MPVNHRHKILKLGIIGLSTILFVAVIAYISTTAAFFLLVASFWSIAIVSKLSPKKVGAFGNRFAQIAPGFLVSLGILGTFIGIAIALQGFDVAAIEKSVPTLLMGLKTAFYSSIFGMVGALVLKLAYPIIDGLEPQVLIEKTPEPIELLSSIHQAIIESNQAQQHQLQTNTLQNMQELLHWIQAGQESMSQKMEVQSERLLLGLQHFAENATSQNNKHMTKALHDVLEQFNVVLGGMASHAFRELQQSIEQLNGWQQQHFVELQQTHQSLQTTLQQLTETSNAFSGFIPSIDELNTKYHSIAESLELITVDCNEISETTSALNEQSQQLTQALSEIKELGESARQVMPAVNEQLTGFLKEVEQSMEKQHASVHRIQEELEQSIQQLRRSRGEQKRMIEQSLEDIKNTLNEVWGKSIDTMVDGLTRISTKFARDYTPLTERLQAVLDVAQQVKSPTLED